MKKKNIIILLITSIVLVGFAILLQSRNAQAAEFVIPETNEGDLFTEFNYVNEENGLTIKNPSITSEGIQLDLQKLSINGDKVGGYWCYNLPSDNAGFVYEPYDGWIVAGFNIQQGEYITEQVKLSTESWITDEKGKNIGRCDCFEVSAPKLNPEEPFSLIANGLRHSYNYTCSEIIDSLAKREPEIKISCEENEYMLNYQVEEKPKEMTEQEVSILMMKHSTPMINTEWVFEVTP
jgi:hypothetical protein